jgi:osmotically-inducible protein OsmY
MSEWNRGGREDDRRRYRDQERRGWSAQDRGSDYEQRDWEQRSFDDQDPGDYRGGSERWRGSERGQASRGGYGSQRYGQGGAQDNRWQAYGSQAYGSGQAYGGRGYGRQDYEHQGYGGQTYGRDQEQDRGRAGQSEFTGRNEPLQRVTEGEADHHGMWSNLGRGEHRGRGPKNYTRSDDRIREDVNDRLSDDAWLDATEVDVTVKSCEVTLNGTVNSRDDRRRAEDLAEQVSGVKHVQNNLRVEQNPQTRNLAGQSAATQARGSGSQIS